LLTNRALTALKTGEPKQAATDADEALKLIGPGNGQGESVAVKGGDGQDEHRDLKELYGKALSRKAEALEQMEKWADAGAVWQQSVEAGVGGSTAVKGRQRCHNALAPKAKAAPKPVEKPRSRPSAAASLAPQKNSEAVDRLREANRAAAREDDEKFVLSEKVDAQVSAWRDGK
ncbi:ubiquitin associated protein, partial [Lasius niger]